MLLTEPRWVDAARALISGCVDLPSLEAKVELMEIVCRSLGDELYPAFLRVLAEVGRRGDHDTRALVAQVLVHALRSGRLPSGRRAAWGARTTTTVPPSLRGARSFGPLEYLCAWAGDESDSSLVAQRDFEEAAHAVMSLVDTDPEARRLYCDKLVADADDPLEGSMSRRTRQAVRVLAQAWGGGAGPAEAASRFVGELARHGGDTKGGDGSGRLGRDDLRSDLPGWASSIGLTR